MIPSFRQQRWLRVLCSFLACSLIAPVSKPLGAAPQEVAPQLKIVILEGDGAVNNVRQRTARDPVVEVRDEGRAREVVQRILAENFLAEEKIDADARAHMMDHAKAIRDSASDYRRLFSLVKAKLAKERGFTL